ncbi:keratin-associated protein 4-6-like [Macrosteles quadrilineatus]|uniref:keratin-associated protein 4-6-like n=1 Tax=Macrosteles quadrilineatus TaxID=74068 RepID=UPI0023E0FF06|nr:keratin-associated protein 4-6-like [Macrosteles quadrilineatus]
MNDCPDCVRKHIRTRRSRHSPRKHTKYRAVSERRRYSPVGCESCSREELRPRKPFCSPCDPCRDRCCIAPEPGLLNTIRNSIQRLFSGRRPNQLYLYSMSQLRCIEQLLDSLEEETCCVEGVIKQSIECDCGTNCEQLRCSLNNISERLESVKFDLMCAKDCYDPCRDRCEFEFICGLMERVYTLERLLQELYFQLECLRTPYYRKRCCDSKPCERYYCGPKTCDRSGCCSPKPCDRTGCCSLKPCDRTGCCSPKTSDRSSCCKKCDTGCRVSCFEKPKRCSPNLDNLGDVCQKGLCRKNSVIPVGVMLVKL